MKIAKRALCGAAAFVIGMSLPLRALAGEQLGQTDFDSGAGLPWHICESGPGKMDFEISDGVYKITIRDPGGASRGGEDRWDCQFRHRGLKIVSGHQYRVQYEITPSESGKYYTKIGNLEGNVEVWHNMSNGYDLDGTWDPIQISAGETKRVDLTFTAGRDVETAEWAFQLGGDGQYTPGGCFPAGTVITFDNMSLIDLTSDENDYVQPEQWQRADILTNQVGYFSAREKRATLLCTDSQPVGFELIDDNGNSVFSGKSTYFGFDSDSEDTVHILDFSEFDGSGTFSLKADNGSESRPFRIFAPEEVSSYSSMLYDSLNYFYQNRSGIDIESRFISSGDRDALARKAGHLPDTAEIMRGWEGGGTGSTLDVTGGWYDAGDHGKYVVNGGISVWLLQNLYEYVVYTGRESLFADGSLNIPESGNGFPDLLDEARWEMEWLLKMQADGGEYDGMAYHKVHDEKWTGLGVAPADDDKKRMVMPPTTAATLNLAASAAQASRLWKDLDGDFSAKCLDAAERAYKAAKAHPDMYAPLEGGEGGGAYGDDDVSDEFFWAAEELYITTGKSDYRGDAEKSAHYMEIPISLRGGENVDTAGSFDWGSTGALGTLSALLNGSEDSGKAKKALAAAAEHYLETEAAQGYGLPYGAGTLSYKDGDAGYVWGSNSFAADNSIILAYAALFADGADRDRFTDGALSGMDYLLGRNAMDISYVTGYGVHTSQYPHHRYWAYQTDSSFPKAPCGVLAGGANSGMQDPWVQGMGWKKGAIPPQKCYLDNIEAWSVNECAINWNAALAWLAAFTAENAEVSPGSGGGSVPEGGEGEAANDVKRVYDTEKAEKIADKERGKSDTGKKVSEKSGEDSGDDKGGSGMSKGAVAAIIAVCAVAGLISAEVFIYKLIKLKSKK